MSSGNATHSRSRAGIAGPPTAPGTDRTHRTPQGLRSAMANDANPRGRRAFLGAPPRHQEDRRIIAIAAALSGSPPFTACKYAALTALTCSISLISILPQRSLAPRCAGRPLHFRFHICRLISQSPDACLCRSQVFVAWNVLLAPSACATVLISTSATP